MTYHGISLRCADGHPVYPGSRSTDGVATEYCPTCHVESLTTVLGVRQYPQRERFEAKLLKKVGKECSSVATNYQRVRTMKSIEVY